MCGIVGYVGRREAQPILFSCLRRLEYRGYDSCGIAILGSEIRIFKDKKPIGKLEQEVPRVEGRIGIGHTRWATHGKPSRENAHPHLDCTGRIAVVHNGIISNFQKLREELSSRGHIFSSETDTEVIAHLVEEHFEGNLLEAVEGALEEVRGSYAIAVVSEGCEEMVVARRESPLVIGVGEGEFLASSDVPGILEYADRVIYLEDGDIGLLTGEEVRLFNQGERIEREILKVPWTLEEAEKGGFEHFMLKEIHEQPRVLSLTLNEYISSVEPSLEVDLKGRDFSEALLLGCGTSYHACLIGRFFFERMAGIPTRVELASEFGSRELFPRNTLAVALTQSGETADTLRAMRKAGEQGLRTLAITNVVGSSITRVANEVFYTRAGPEIGVAATKSFLAQLLNLYLLALHFGEPDPGALRRYTEVLRDLPGAVERVLEGEELLAQYGRFISGYGDAFFVARGINYPVGLEGALKLKEISYIHAEGYPAGELKHGPFALLTKDTPVIGVLSRDETHNLVLSNLKEIKARESPLIALVPEEDREGEKYADHVIRIPELDPLLSPFVNVVALQLLAYHAARERSCSIDHPRNLAKSVTVE